MSKQDLPPLGTTDVKTVKTGVNKITSFSKGEISLIDRIDTKRCRVTLTDKRVIYCAWCPKTGTLSPIRLVKEKSKPWKPGREFRNEPEPTDVETYPNQPLDVTLDEVCPEADSIPVMESAFLKTMLQS